MVYLIPQKAMYHIIAHQDEVHEGLRKEATEVKGRAEANLAAARGTTRHVKIDQAKAHMTEIGMGEAEGQYSSIDFEVYMDGDDPMATEFGHAPSGHFNPDTYGKVTKAPQGLYILTRAAGTGDLELTPAPTRERGKR